MVNEAATRVGYESSAQFSREFKQYFASTPVSFLSCPKPGPRISFSYKR